MASKTTTRTRPAATLQQLHPDEIAPHPKNPRHNLGDLKELTASIAEQGVLEPIVVEPLELVEHDVPGGSVKFKDARRWLLIHGHRRLAAAQAAGLDTVPAMVFSEASALEEQVARMLVENLQRAGLTAVEEGDGYQELLDLGWDTATIAQRVSRPKRKVADLVKVAGLPEAARERISEGQLTLEDASRMAKFANDGDAMDELQEQAGVSKWAFENTLARIEKRKQQDREIAKWKKDLRASGVKVLTTAEVEDLEEYADLEDLPASAVGDAADLDPDVDHFEDEWDRLALAAHASCAGAFGYVESGSWGSVRHLCCSQPTLHDHNTAGSDPGTDVELDERGEAELAALEERRKQREQEERARAELQLNLAAAGVARRHFLGEVLDAPEADEVAKTLLRREIDPLLAGKVEWRATQQRLLAEILLPNATQDSLDKSDLPDRIRKALAGLTVTQLVLIAQLVDRLQGEEALSKRPLAWTSTDAGWIGGPAAWKKDLAEVWGYSWSDFEQELINGDQETNA